MPGTGRRQAGEVSAHKFVYEGHVLHVPSHRREILRCALTCIAIAIGEMYPSHVRLYCHPEEAARPTKDLLRHGIIPA